MVLPPAAVRRLLRVAHIHQVAHSRKQGVEEQQVAGECIRVRDVPDFVTDLLEAAPPGGRLGAQQEFDDMPPLVFQHCLRIESSRSEPRVLRFPGMVAVGGCGDGR